MKNATSPQGLRLALLTFLVPTLLLAGRPAFADPQDKPAAPPKPSTTMTLDECIVQAVRRNLGITVQVFTYRQADQSVVKAGEKFLPTLSFDYNQNSQNSASYSWIDAADVVATQSRSYTGSVSQNAPLGGSFSVAMATERYNSNSTFQTINPYYSGALSFTYTQPLLKDFGWKTSRQEILIARNNRNIAANDLKETLIETVYAVEANYWELVYRIESLAVQRQSLKLAEDLLDKSRKEAAIGTLAPKEVISAQAEVASRKADILQAEMLVRDSSDTLHGLLNLAFDKDASDLVPADTPQLVKSDLGLDEAMAAAFVHRPDLQSASLDIRNKQISLTYAKNQTLPALNLTTRYWSPGLSGDQILFQDDNPLTGIVIGRVSNGSSQAVRDALHFKYDNWSVALTLDIPLSTIFTRAARAQAQSALDQQTAILKQKEQNAMLEIRAAVRAVQTNYERVLARRSARELAEEKLQAEESKLKVGLSNNFYVLTYQRDLASAKTAELRALIDYTLSQGQLDKAMGTSLDKRNIKFTDAAEVQR
ncbi:MAG: TolC family protein [Acidobacteriota bacterium]|nr:TolC family protein [Acidobacteriota bacterium]